MSDQCFSNDTYNDFGAGYECGDNYSSLEGAQTCGIYGPSVYARGGLLNGKSSCAQSSDYAGADNMYKRTTLERPDIDLISIYTPQTTQVDSKYANPAVTSTGAYLYPRGIKYSTIQEQVQAESDKTFKNLIGNIERGQGKLTQGILGAQKFIPAQAPVQATERYYYLPPAGTGTAADALKSKLM